MYLEWSVNNSAFVFQIEVTVFLILAILINSLVTLSIVGQMDLFNSFFQNIPLKIAAFISLGFIGLL